MARLSLLLATLVLAPTLVASPFDFTFSAAYYDATRNLMVRDINLMGPLGTETYHVPAMDVVSSSVLGNLGVLVLAGQMYGDPAVRQFRYGSGGCDYCLPDVVPFRYDQIPEAYPAGYVGVPFLTPQLTGWDNRGHLTGYLWAQTVLLSADSGVPWVQIPYTWDIQVNTTHNPEPQTLAMVAGGLAIFSALAARQDSKAKGKR